MAHLMVDATYSALHERPKTLNRVGVNVPHHPHLGTMADPLVLLHADSDTIIDDILIRKDRTLGKDVLAHQSENALRRDIGSGHGFDSPNTFLRRPLDDSNHRSLLLVAAHGSSSVPLAGSTVVHLIHFDRSAQRCAVILEKGANLVEHAPRGFVGDASFAFDLFCRDSATCGGHQVDRMEPRLKRSRGLVEDRSSGRVNVMAAMIARIRGAARYAMVLRDILAELAVDAIRVQVATKPFQTGRIVWKHLLKVFECEAAHLRLFVRFFDLAHNVPTVAPIL